MPAPADPAPAGSRNLGKPIMYHAVIEAPFCKIGVRIEADAVREIVYLPESAAALAPATPLAREAAAQIRRYLEQASAGFDLPLAIFGTAFQRRVWAAIAEIPRGAVLTYGQLAERVGAVPRAVGQACGANPLPLVIPCHRVVAARGLGGFAHHTDGYLLKVKRWLLAHEEDGLL
jgi:methylated-DNA-[protein]-cysteine S-methyltransferase